jgi:hypothetical protein
MISKHKSRPLYKEQDREPATGAIDPVLAMLGVGRQLWELEPGDNFVERLRSEDLSVPPAMHPSHDPAGNLPEAFVGPRATTGEARRSQEILLGEPRRSQ